MNQVFRYGRVQPLARSRRAWLKMSALPQSANPAMPAPFPNTPSASARKSRARVVFQRVAAAEQADQVTLAVELRPRLHEKLVRSFRRSRCFFRNLVDENVLRLKAEQDELIFVHRPPFTMEQGVRRQSLSSFAEIRAWASASDMNVSSSRTSSSQGSGPSSPAGESATCPSTQSRTFQICWPVLEWTANFAAFGLT